MKFYEPQPAYLVYAYSGGWQVMEYVFKNVFSKTDAAARYWYKQAANWQNKAAYEDSTVLKYWYWSAVVGFFLAGLSQYASAMLLVAVFVVIQFVILVVWVCITTLLISFLTLINFLYGYYYKIFFRCPDCHEQMSIPIMVCPVCATEHTRLWPSPYGVLSHRCSNCNTKLPTLDILGRKDLVQKCVACERPMNKEVGRLINIHIPVIGGPTTGKSNYIFMATHHFIENYASPRNYKVEFPDEKHKQVYDRNVRNLSSGKALTKTPDVVPQAYNLAIKKPRDQIGRIVYIYDAAGEAYADEDNATLQSYFKYVHGLILIIDPFSIEFYRRQHEDEINKLRTSLRPSTLSVMDAYERMLTVLEASVGLRRGKRFQHPIAVVLSKTDALNLEDQIGQSAAQDLIDENPAIRLEEDAISLQVEQFLIENKLGNFVRDLYLQFDNVKFFSCSALGRMPDASNHNAFEPVRVLDPLLWILGQMNVVGAQQERIRKIDADHKVMARAQNGVFKAAKFYYWDSLKPRK